MPPHVVIHDKPTVKIPPTFNRPEEKLAQFTSREDLLRSLWSSVDEFDQFFLVVRRGSSFQRQLKIWQRESKRSSPE